MLHAGAILLALCGPVSAAGPRLVSINLITDTLHVALADPDQILGLSPFARDAARSSILDEARRYTVLSGTAEEVLAIRPDLVLAGRYTKRATRQMIKQHGIRVEEFDAANSIQEAIEQIRQVGRLVGHPDRAEGLTREIDAALQRARKAADTAHLTILPLQRRGWVSGRKSLMTSLLDAVGLRNAGAGLATSGRFVGLEELVTLRPDLLLVAGGEKPAEDQGSALLEHPALKRLFPPERRIVMPEQMTLCGGPALVQTLDALAKAVSSRRTSGRP